MMRMVIVTRSLPHLRAFRANSVAMPNQPGQRIRERMAGVGLPGQLKRPSFKEAQEARHRRRGMVVGVTELPEAE
jgi:hypothetical protein